MDPLVRTIRYRLIADLLREHQATAHGTLDEPKYTCDMCSAFRDALDAERAAR